MDDDEQLVAAAAAGDQQAYGALVERHQARLYNTLYRVMHSADDALDISQEAFVQAYLKLDSFRRDSRFYTWLYRIAMNLALSALRKRKNTASIEDIRSRGAPDPVDPLASPDERLDGAERVAVLERALSMLGEQPRQILVLRELEEFTYEQIAEVLDVPVGTVRSRLFRARAQLKEQLRVLMPEEADATDRPG
ncbi:MAG: sigma-70 family RNA polymerase sigma factor [Planctomycetota bacterium]